MLDDPAHRALAHGEVVWQLGRQLGVAERERALQPLRAGVVGPQAHVGRVEELRDGAREVL